MQSQGIPVRQRIRRLMVLLALGTGLSVNNSRAVIEAMLGVRSAFKRTPKFAVTRAGKDWHTSAYVLPSDPTVWVEVVLALYANALLVYSLFNGFWWLLPLAFSLRLRLHLYLLPLHAPGLGKTRRAPPRAGSRAGGGRLTVHNEETAPTGDSALPLPDFSPPPDDGPLLRPAIAPPLDNTSRCALLVMAKQPIAGRAKTRLVPPLTSNSAASLYHCFLQDILATVRAAVHIVPFTPVIAFTPAAAQ